MSKVPFICNSCETIKKYSADQITRECPECGGGMEIDYQDNYEIDLDHTPCNGCLYLRVGEGEKCNYCKRI